MALSGSISPSVQRITAGRWADDAEKAEILAAFKADAGVKVDEVYPLLAHDDSAVRAVASAAFAERADTRAIEKVIADSPNLPDASRPVLIGALSRLDPSMIAAAAGAHTQSTNAARLRFAWELLLALPASRVEEHARRALVEAPAGLRPLALERLAGALPPDQVRAFLITLARDNEPRLRQRAIERLTSLPDAVAADTLELLVERWINDNAAVRSYIRRALIASAPRQGPALRARLLRALPSVPPELYASLLEMVFRSGRPDAIAPKVLSAVASLPDDARGLAVQALRNRGDELASGALSLLHHHNAAVASLAMLLAENLDDPRVVPSIAGLTSNPDWWVRSSACLALARLRADPGVDAIVKLADDPKVGASATRALASMATEKSLAALEGLLRHRSASVRRSALEAAGSTGLARFSRTVDAIAQGDPDPAVKNRALGLRGSLLRDRPPERIARSSARVEERAEGDLEALLAGARQRGASDIHVTVDEPPFARLQGQLLRLEGAALSEAQVESMIRGALLPAQSARLDAEGEIDLCVAVKGSGRFRANVFRQRRGICGAFRCVPVEPPTFADLRLPGQLTELLDYHQGIILVSGPAGGGKSTTLAAIIDLINETRADHVITLEDPIEFVHPIKRALINQREVGTHTRSFSRALRGALREDPDVIMVGEMRDLETVRLALGAAETGHLVIATMHTTDAVSTVSRLIESFAPDEQPQVRMGLSESLKYVVSQSLCPRADGKGRVAIYEVLKNTSNVGALIRDNKLVQIANLIQISRTMGMQTRDQALEELLDAGLITAATAYARAERRELFEARAARSAAA